MYKYITDLDLIKIHFYNCRQLRSYKNLFLQWFERAAKMSFCEKPTDLKVTTDHKIDKRINNKISKSTYFYITRDNFSHWKEIFFLSELIRVFFFFFEPSKFKDKKLSFYIFWRVQDIHKSSRFPFGGGSGGGWCCCSSSSFSPKERNEFSEESLSSCWTLVKTLPWSNFCSRSRIHCSSH